MIDDLAQRAAETVNWAFEHLRSQIQVIPSEISADDLLQEITIRSGDIYTARMMKDLLIHFGAIAAGDNAPHLASALRRPTEDGVLKYRRDTGNYVVPAPYRAALQDLQQRANRIECSA
jgi:hypothetical protein